MQLLQPELQRTTDSSAVVPCLRLLKHCPVQQSRHLMQRLRGVGAYRHSRHHRKCDHRLGSGAGVGWDGGQKSGVSCHECAQVVESLVLVWCLPGGETRQSCEHTCGTVSVTRLPPILCINRGNGCSLCEKRRGCIAWLCVARLTWCSVWAQDAQLLRILAAQRLQNSLVGRQHACLGAEISN